MEQLSGTMMWVFAIALGCYVAVMYLVGYLAQRRIVDVEDYLLAGRRLPLSLTTLTIVATWFGAESLMTTADEVSQHGIRRAMLDPIGISLCLVIAGLVVAGPIWRMNLLTIPDFFRQRFGKSAEILASLILAPSYFGWVAAQFVALATILNQFMGLPYDWAIVGVAVFGTGYAIMGGMWSITWTDTIQMVFIIAGLVILGYEILAHLGGGDIIAGIEKLRTGPPEAHWRLADEATFHRDMMVALSALLVGSLGNLPVQDLLQRIQSAESDRVAQRACLIASASYLVMGLMPIGAGLSAAMILQTVPDEGVVTTIAQRLLNPACLIVFLLAIVSTVLSTIVSAVMAPAAIIAHNLLEPLGTKAFGPLSANRQLLLQRACVIAVTIASTALAFSGAGAYELVQGSYSMSLVGLFVPFMFGLLMTGPSPWAAIAAILTGTLTWAIHLILGWDDFLQPYFENCFPVPHELMDTLASGIAFAIFSIWSIKRTRPTLDYQTA